MYSYICILKTFIVFLHIKIIIMTISVIIMLLLLLKMWVRIERWNFQTYSDQVMFKDYFFLSSDQRGLYKIFKYH